MRRVYFLRRVDGEGSVKIGCSHCPEARRKYLSSRLKTELALLAEAPGDYFEEQRMHRLFAEDREAGEWFRASPALLAAIEQAKMTGKLPPPNGETREQEFQRRYLAGETYQSIAEDHGCTRERVRQVLRQIGVPSAGYRSSVVTRAARAAWRRRRAAA